MLRVCMGLKASPPLNTKSKLACTVRVRCWVTRRGRSHGGLVVHVPLIWLDPRAKGTYGVCRVTPAAGFRPGPEIQSDVGLGS